ncbi:MAG: DUF2993 domain-containing protein [Limnoraphis robusta]|jgi:hypothetical protein
MGSTQATSKQLVSKVLSRAVKLWLRSQVEQVDALEIKITANNRDCLTGHISEVTVEASRAIYRGLHLSQIALCGSSIHINIGQVIKGKPLQLLKRFPIDSQICMFYDDLSTSCQSLLLLRAISQFLLPLIQSQQAKNPNISLPNEIQGLQNLQITLAKDQITLTAEILSTDGMLTACVFQTELYLASPKELLLLSPRLELPLQQQDFDLDDMTLDLGTDVEIEQLNISPEQVEMIGQIWVNP